MGQPSLPARVPARTITAQITARFLYYTQDMHLMAGNARAAHLPAALTDVIVAAIAPPPLAGGVISVADIAVEALTSRHLEQWVRMSNGAAADRAHLPLVSPPWPNHFAICQSPQLLCVTILKL